MKKDILRQYENMKREKGDTERRIRETQSQLEKLNSKYHVQDCVSGGMGGIEHFTIKGFPYPEYDRKRTLLLQRQLRLQTLDKKLDEKLDEVEQYIDSIEDSRKRLILKLRFIDGMTWRQVAKRLGPGNKEDSIRIEIDRFIKNGSGT